MAEDPELAAIRARRMAEMQAQSGGVGGADQMKKQQEAMQREKEMKNSMLAQILDQGARARLNSIALVKPEKAAMIENMLIQMARSGQLGGKMTEEGLVGVLEKVNQQMANKNKVTITRRRYAMDSDSDDD
ncbi:programmed cell death protein 5-like [Clytia hemisphaerica]|uniref:Programmed cell death protein 5 n=1 Tax=Clytia hemisphaerica TaxID=252671 RepID=A0A7M5V5D9_9CNID|eukprot:TCONS_00009379-protein